ncbi:FH2 domain-containing protein [Sergentomyia squamirostris]
MDPRTGLDYIVDNKDYVQKLGSALDTENVTVKKQIVELLSALCAYSAEGYNRAIETLEHFMNHKKERYRLKIVVRELENTTMPEYQMALLAFINCLIISAPTLQRRIKIRNEFIGLNLLSVLNNLRPLAKKHPDIKVQLDVFDEQRESDEAQNLQDPDGINLNSHLDVFYAILRQVSDTPQGIPFLSILQHLLRIDPKEAVSDLIWDTAETLVHRATLLENHEDSVRLLRAPSVQKIMCPHCRTDISATRKQSIATGSLASPPPPPLPALSPPPPPPPAMADTKPVAPPPPPPMAAVLKPTVQAPPPPQAKTPEPPSTEPQQLLPQQEIPVPRSKMKTINWNKIPSNRILGKHNIWSSLASSHSTKEKGLDFEEIEDLFCQQATPNPQASPKLGRDKTDTLERKKKENSEISLLDGKRSLNVNIFLKQFRSSNENIINLIRNGEHEDVGAERLRGLLKILPEVDELDMLKSFDGDKSRLGNAEKFLLELLKLSNYKLRIECMLLKEEFAANVGYLEPAIRAMLYAGDDLMTNKSLQEVLYMVLLMGNFLNSGGYAGNAAGVKLSSLQKLTDIRANKPGMNLIHYVALQAEKTNPKLLDFPAELTTLENATKTSVEQLNNELLTLSQRIEKIKKNIDSPNTDIDIKKQMVEFLKISEQEVDILQRYMIDLDKMKIKLADFFVEEVKSFKLEECFKIFRNFREKFRQAVVDNERRRIQEQQANFRRKQREDQLAMKRRQLTPELSLGLDSQILDPNLLSGSPAMQRRRIGSFTNNNNELASPKDPGPSPEGTLRRRKSRNLNEDESLMDFLRSSGHDNFSRERKTSYGSLDRSWARRARAENGIKKRPDLFHVDFTADRERANSPSSPLQPHPIPTIEKESPSEEATKQPRISKEWHEKIQTWLQHNDPDSRKKRLSQRKSYEEDSENERKLDPLPEEKVPHNEPTPKRTIMKWKPSNTIEITDVVGTIEAIQESQPKPREPRITSPDGSPRKSLIAGLGERNPEHKVPSILSSDVRKKDDIDADNRETPPTPRKSLVNSGDYNDGEVLGTGQFDRFSSARKTRRFKRSNFNMGTNSEDIPPAEDVSKAQIFVESSKPVSLEKKQFALEDKEARLKRWQERLKCLDEPEIKSNPRRFQIGEKAGNVARSAVKTSACEFNDEGFEESQSLVSDTQSQGKETSSGNENTDPQVNLRETPSAIVSEIVETPKRISDLMPKRTYSMRNSPSAPAISATKPLYRRNSLRKNDSKSSVTSLSSRNVERSGSRGSLRSSRSSLNSGVSTNTVKRIPAKPPPSRFTAAPLQEKKPLHSASSLRLAGSTTRVPASRSSSSNSSIGSSSLRMKPTSTGSNFVRTPSVSDNLANGTPFRSLSGSKLPNIQNGSVASRRNNFMRPTTASTTKAQAHPSPPIGGPNALLRSRLRK